MCFNFIYIYILMKKATKQEFKFTKIQGKFMPMCKYLKIFKKERYRSEINYIMCKDLKKI